MAFAAVVVATPRDWFLAFAVYALLVFSALVIARVPPRVVARRMTIELPFVVFALLLPFIATGPTIEVGPFTLAVEGLWGAWALLAKATLAVGAATVLISTTEPRRMVQALGQLRLPAVLTSIIGFMIRYLDLIVEETRRMRIARESRGFRARGLASWRIIAQAAGSVIVRSHARGERVHLAMLSRGGAG
ncbi:MAG: cobalt ECF transporter T component CbiQ [Microbacterium sp. 67-17]|nr:MAG: cobalt ECF transporter T component CbiQ [Microbacterium sp. 67-17]